MGVYTGTYNYKYRVYLVNFNQQTPKVILYSNKVPTAITIQMFFNIK